MDKFVLFGIASAVALSGCGVTINTTSSGPQPPGTTESTTASNTNHLQISTQHSSAPQSPNASTPSPSSYAKSAGVTTQPVPRPQFTTGVWYPTQNDPVAFDIPLPTAFGPFTQKANPYRAWGWYWSSSADMQVAISLLPSSIAQFNGFQAPSGDTVLKSGGDSGAQVMIWSSPNGMIDANEIVSTGTIPYGWRTVLGDAANDRTFLMNVTLPDTPTNISLAEQVLARWSVVDTHTGATYSGNQPPGHHWLPEWPLNPLDNSNAGSMPAWLRASM